MPVRRGRAARFLATFEAADALIWRKPKHVRLAWYSPHPELKPGQRWNVTVRLLRPGGFSNPGGFDFERYLFARGVTATGYVRPGTAILVSNDRPLPLLARLNRLRFEARSRIAQVLAGEPRAGVVSALAIGDRSQLTREDWQVMAKSGTSHLMAISGLHVGLAAGFGFLAGAGAVWGFPRALRGFGRARAGALGAVALAAVYAAMAGLEVPTQRALVMTSVAAVALFAGRRIPLGVLLSAAAVVVVALWPSVLLTNGFWLSFGAVAVLVWGFGYRVMAPKCGRLWWRWGRPQLIIAVGLAPALLGFFGNLPLLGPMANAMAIPWVSFLAVPPAVLGTLLVEHSWGAGEALLHISETSLNLLWPALELAARGSPDIALPAIPGWGIALACLASGVLLAPAGVVGRAVTALLLAPLVTLAPERPAHGEVVVTLLDVGQGLSVVAETASEVLVYDVGARFGPEFDAALAAAVPFLRGRGWREVDRVVLSHGDSDHVGGFDSLRRSLPLKRVLTNASLPGPIEPCEAGVRWHSDGVRFEVIHPSPGDYWRSNDSSCVLVIEAGSTRFLLAGDIETPAERYLERTMPERLHAQVLVVPHHGSNTSSSQNFLAAVQPRLALISAGYRNRYQMPHDAVLHRLRTHGAAVRRTDFDGAVTVRAGPSGIIRVTSHRAQSRAYWHR